MRSLPTCFSSFPVRERSVVARENRYSKAAVVFATLVIFLLSKSAVADRAAVSLSAGTVDFVQNYCVACHNEDDQQGGLNLDQPHQNQILATPALDLRSSDSEEHRHSNWQTWEHVLKRLETRQMPPPDAERPSEQEYESIVETLAERLDQLSARVNDPGRVPTFRRLTRTEYQNSIRDLLRLKVDATGLLPKDEASFGFDNITVTGLTPMLMNRYVKAAETIAKLAVSASSNEVVSRTIRLPPDRTQDQHVLGLPLGTRGGLLVDQYFAVPGEYEVSVRLMRDRNEEVEGMTREHELHMLLNRKKMASFKIQRPKNATEHLTADQHLKARIVIPAGQQKLGITFVDDSDSLIETRRQPLNVQFNHHRHRRQGPAVYSVSIAGPYPVDGLSADTSSRRLLFGESANRKAEQGTDLKSDERRSAARTILHPILRMAYRRPIDDEDFKVPLQFFDQKMAVDEADFEFGIQAALEAILVNPNFLFRVQRQPDDVSSGEAYRVDDLELASRLSFFLWSSLPDEELLSVAEAGQLQDAATLEHQVRRLLRDSRSDALVTNFARQWLYLGNLQSVSPDARLFPDFDQNLREAMKRETELFFQDVVKRDLSVTQLLKSEYTFLNERLARHYDVPHVLGSRFRKVNLKPDDHRGGLLRHGSLLTVTSYATRTSPVLRGNWVLKNLLGTPPPPPPENVPDLKDNTVDASLSVRERLNEHRANPACASCHNLMDPIGFSLECYDAVGRYRPYRQGRKVDATGGLPDGLSCDGVSGLEQGLVARPEIFVATLTEKLMTYGLGRGLSYRDRAAVRRIVADSAEQDFRFSQIVISIVNSQPFQMRTAE